MKPPILNTLFRKKRRSTMSVPSFQSDTIERQAMFNRRIFMMGSVIAFGLFALTGRLMHLQFIQGGRYRKLSEANQYNFRIIPPQRGNILDREGRVIAGNRPSFRVMIMANEVKDIDSTLDQLTFILPQIATSRRRILRSINENQRYVPTLVAADLNWEDFSKVSLYAAEIPGVVADMADIRVYQHGGAFSHVVGYVSRMSGKEYKKEAEAAEKEGDTADALLLHPSFRIGKTGIEKAYDLELRGVAGAHKVEVNSLGQVIADDMDGSSQPKAGKDVVLNLDLDIQNRALEVFGEESGSAVMMNIETGEVLCMTSTPAFDPNLFVSGISTKAYSLLRDYERIPLLDKAIGSTFAPGSTFKTLVAVAALESGLDPKIVHTCHGNFPFGNHVFRCDGVHGSQDLHSAIVTSCDVYFYKTALAIGPTKIAAIAKKFGLGQIFDIPIQGQKAGVVPDEAWKKAYYEKRQPNNTKWWPGETPSMGIGQGYTNINALQNCVMVARLANGRKAVVPRLVKSVGGEPVAYPAFENLQVDPGHIDFVRAAMADVVTQGTAARSGQLGLGPIMMAGKTGTAQSHTYAKGAHATLHMAWEKRDHAWFVAFAPADKPKYACAVIVEHGGWGASAAAPKAREIMRVALLKDPEIRKRILSSGATDANLDINAKAPDDPSVSSGTSSSTTNQ